MGLELPSSFLSFGWRRRILDSVEHRQQSTAGALHKGSSPSPSVATRNSRRPGDRRFGRKSASELALASASKAAATAVPPPPPPPSVRVTSPSPPKDIGFGKYEGEETVTIKVEQGGNRRKETASPPSLPPPPRPPRAKVVSSRRSKDLGCGESGRRESLTARTEQKEARVMWLWEPDDAPPEMARILDRRSGGSQTSSCGVHGRRGSELANTSQGREWASTAIPSE